jgi:hypothetical protein
MIMKRILQSLCLAAFVCFSTSWSCAQNGPTQPTVQLTWVQSTTSGVTSNHVYRCIQTGTTACVPAPPAIFGSTAPITSYTDSTVAPSTTYVYAVTASINATESQYSSSVTAAIPASPNAPTNLTAPTVTGKLAIPQIKDRRPDGLLGEKVDAKALPPPAEGFAARVVWIQLKH